MAKSKRKVYIKELVEADHSEVDKEFINLRKHLKSGTGSPFQTKPNFLTAIYDRSNKNMAMISEARSVRWRIFVYATLLFMAVVAAVKLTAGLSTAMTYKVVISAVAGLSLILMYFAAFRLLDRMGENLDFLNEHARLNEEMLGVTLGMQKLANDVVSSRRPGLRIRHDFSAGVHQEEKSFAAWLYGILAGMLALSMAVSAAVIWV